MDASIIAALAGAAGIAITKIFDFFMSKNRDKTKIDMSYNELMMKENAAFRQEMREEVRVLRNEVSQLREENFQLRAENSRLLLRISELEDELRVMRKIAGYDHKEYNVIAIESPSDDEDN